LSPGNCLIDQWIRLNSTNRYDQDGEIARSGKINKMVLISG
jgi:anhydro-N-acetylmuramic acid kinase